MIFRQYLGGAFHVLDFNHFSHQFKAVGRPVRLRLRLSSLILNRRTLPKLWRKECPNADVTVLAAKDGLFLLVQEQRQSYYSLPGGGIERNEPSLLAAVREVHEETRLKMSSIRYLGDLDGRRAMHFVFYAEVYGNVRLQRKEIAGYKWWDGHEPIPVQGHVNGALVLLRKSQSPKG